MKLNKNFIVHHTEDESMLVPLGDADFSGIVRGNRTFGGILDCLKEDTTAEEIIARMKEQYDAEDGEIERDVRRAIADLSGIGALDA